MMKWQTVAIVGVGLIGGSIGLAVRRRGVASRVVGIGRRSASLRRAQEAEAVDDVTVDLAEGVADADLVVVCTPVESIVPTVLEVARICRSGALITDAGSTKESIVREIGRRGGKDIRFIGGHPIAGSDKSGPEHADADLFEGRMVIATPTRGSRRTDVERLRRFWESLGAKVTRMSPAAHDKVLAVTSHLPHVVSTVLAAATPARCMPYVGSGWEDTTRIAQGDVELWLQILGQNRENVVRSLERYIDRLATMKNALSNEDPRTVARILAAGKRNRESMGS